MGKEGCIHVEYPETQWWKAIKVTIRIMELRRTLMITPYFVATYYEKYDAGVTSQKRKNVPW